MADIVDPEIVRFLNEFGRPMAEELRALASRADAMVMTYARLVGKLPKDGSRIKDGRDREGVSQVKDVDLEGLMLIVKGVRDRLQQAGVASTVEGFCVRPLEVR